MIGLPLGFYIFCVSLLISLSYRDNSVSLVFGINKDVETMFLAPVEYFSIRKRLKGNFAFPIVLLPEEE